jgi:CDP-diacylglycerol---serine O-phosphatidyltransferase
MYDAMNEGMTADDQPKYDYARPQSIEDATNRYFIHPISEHVVRFGVAVGLNPNFVSLLGLACGFLAAFLFLDLPDTQAVAGGFVAMLAWHIFDGADGKLARATGKASAFGRIIDGICDHLVFGAIYLAFTLQMISAGFPLAVWWLVIAAALSHTVQAAAYEERRQKFQRRHSGLERSAISEKLLNIDGERSLLAALYDRAQTIIGGSDRTLDEKLQILRQQGGNENKIIALVNRCAPMVRAWGLLNANNRTIMIGLTALLGQPVLYFLYETIVLNIVLIGLVFAEGQHDAKLAKSVEIETLA